MEIAHSRSSVGYLLGDVQMWGEAKVCGFLCLSLPDSTFFLLRYAFFRCAACFLGGSKHSPYICNLQWQCQPIKSLDCLLMPSHCWPSGVMWLEMTHTNSCWLNVTHPVPIRKWLIMTHADSCCCARLYCAWSISLWCLAMYVVMKRIWNESFCYAAKGWYKRSSWSKYLISPWPMVGNWK